MWAVRGWLLALIAASLLCALAGALMPSGGVKQVGRLVCGLTLLAAILQPLAGLDMAEVQQWLADYFAALELRETELEETVDGQMKVIIDQRCAAYIVDKAAQLGLTCEARVECRAEGNGVYLPVRAEVSGTLGEAGRARLASAIAEDLGIPKEEQIYLEKEDVP